MSKALEPVLLVCFPDIEFNDYTRIDVEHLEPVLPAFNNYFAYWFSFKVNSFIVEIRPLDFAFRG
jgi:hypothetical protein